ncbi:MAG: DEAD/DEAH box helicase [Candidatus ainarchaeum sp.]|nr:DEAD/DEAH box helicase [Candidatus ainarchaeum sp.]
MEFRNLNLSEKTLAALAKLGYINPTEVQERAIPDIIAGHNLIVRSHTGTGKTAAFGIGIIERIAAGKSKKALIMTPTRELAVQVCKEIQGIGQMHSLRISVVYGGHSINIEEEQLRKGVDILVATPGRLLDLSRRGAVRIGEFDIAILDEADQMLDMGFMDEMTAILDQLPQHRITLLLSATVDESILNMASKYVKHHKTIEIGEIAAAETIKQEHIEATDREKFPKLLDVLDIHKHMKTLVFRETKMGVERLQERLWQRGVKAGALQGDMSQAARNRVLADFKEGKLNVLVATNVAARGLHIENLGLIVNYDKAQSEQIHLHRIGRTGRMGHEGKAINFVLRKESLQERMSTEHPDFAWMKEGGTSLYSRDREPRRGPPRRPYGEGRPHREGYPSHGTHPTTHHGEGHTRPHSAQGEHRPHGGPSHRRRPPQR